MFKSTKEELKQALLNTSNISKEANILLDNILDGLNNNNSNVFELERYSEDITEPGFQTVIEIGYQTIDDVDKILEAYKSGQTVRVHYVPENDFDDHEFYWDFIGFLKASQTDIEDNRSDVFNFKIYPDNSDYSIQPINISSIYVHNNKLRFQIYVD